MGSITMRVPEAASSRKQDCPNQVSRPTGAAPRTWVTTPRPAAAVMPRPRRSRVRRRAMGATLSLGLRPDQVAVGEVQEHLPVAGQDGVAPGVLVKGQVA